MRKAQKRELGRQRQAVNREESRLSGLMAQGRAKKEREKEVQDAIEARAKRSKKVIPENEGNSKLALAKKQRVEARLSEMELSEFSTRDADLDLSTVDC